MDIQLDAGIPEGDISEKWEHHKFKMKLVAPHNRRRFEVIVVDLVSGVAAARGVEGERRVRHVRLVVGPAVRRGHEMTPRRVKIGTSEKPPAMTTARVTPSRLALRRALALLVRPRVCAALQTPCRRCMARAAIATR